MMPFHKCIKYNNKVALLLSKANIKFQKNISYFFLLYLFTVFYFLFIVNVKNVYLREERRFRLLKIIQYWLHLPLFDQCVKKNHNLFIIISANL